MYLGLKMERSDIEDIIGKARYVNPDIAIYLANRNFGGRLVLNQV